MTTKESLLAWLGKTKTAARRVMSAYLKTMPVDVYMQDPRLQALCQFHPTRKFPAEEMRFVLSARPPYNTKSLFFEARTGGLMDLSWVRCIENLYGSYTKEKNQRANTLAALRNEVYFSAILFDFIPLTLDPPGVQVQGHAASAREPRHRVRAMRQGVPEAGGGPRREAVRADPGRIPQGDGRVARGAQDPRIEEGLQAPEARPQVAQVSRQQRHAGGDLRQVQRELELQGLQVGEAELPGCSVKHRQQQNE